MHRSKWGIIELKSYREILLFFTSLFIFSINSCVTTGLFTTLGSPYSILAEIQPLNSQKISNSGNTYKVGESCSYNLLGIIVFGDSSIRTAIDKGNIFKPIVVDYSIINYSHLIGVVCTKVAGE